jgi:7-carboxy-7-deazaguanine synthase (Cx14CxxC type)
MTYSIKEIFYTLQGEGANAGRSAVFCRFTGCNLWSGYEADRADAICNFCDTDFVGVDGANGGKFNKATELAETVDKIWNTHVTNSTNKFIVCTGGEPLLQLDTKLIQAFHELSFEVAVETNGTQPAPSNIDWICVSPKTKVSDLLLTSGDELKFVYPQEIIQPEQFENFEFDLFYLVPMDGKDKQKNTQLSAEYCLKNPKWKLNLQMHKLIGLP